MTKNTVTPDAAAAVSMNGDAIVLIGSGLLREATAAALQATMLRPTTPASGHATTAGAIVVLSDADDTRDHARAERRAAAIAVPWLAVRVEAGRILIGPARLPDRPGCPVCAELRRAGNRPGARELQAVRERCVEESAERPCPLLTPWLASAVGALVCEEVGRLLAAPETARTYRALLRISVMDGVSTRHRLLPDPRCPVCAGPPADASGMFAPVPELVSDPGSLRAGRLTDRLEELMGLYVDAETGLVQSLGRSAPVSGATVVARLRPALTHHDSQHGYGCAGDYRTATATALAEALERWAGPYPRGGRATVRAAFGEVAAYALDPRNLGLYPDHLYETAGWPFRRFDPGDPIDWAWGHSFARGEPVLVPASFAYYGPRPGAPGLAYECSNGCATGGGPAEAVLHGLLEIAERDAFLATWYTRMAIPRIDIDSARDPHVRVAAAAIGERLGYEVMAFSSTLEQGVPAVWAMAVDRLGGPDRPRVLCGAGAHLNAERALGSAIRELGSSLEGHVRRYAADRGARLLAEPDRVREMDDHALLYGHPDAQDRFAFLPMDGPRIGVGDIGTGTWPRHHDLRDHLTDLVERYLLSGLDVITVDTTGPELRAGGFTCAKVIVPGTVPMTFGHRFRRVHGLPRLLSIPRLLGRADRDLEPAELNPDPHPFP